MNKLILKYIFLSICFCTVALGNAQENAKSYALIETRTQNGQIGQVPINNTSTYVEWFDDGTIRMLDGTVWRFINQTWDGVRHYAYVGATGPIMPGTQYIEVMFSNDWTLMQINYLFGMMGSYMNMCQIYQYIGEGKTAANDWFYQSF